MDDPAMSLFQGNVINVGDNDNQEEVEDLEEQIRRREELQNLLINALDEFKYEDSTINSSTNVSVASADCIQQNYRDVQTPYEQLKLLYDIRMKEIEALKDEFDSFKEKSNKEIDSLKRRLTLQEAETSQVEISLRNTKSLLVEKVDIIDRQGREISSKNEEINKLKTVVEQLQYDVQAYNSTIEELHLKLTMDTGPFNVAARVFNAEELQNNHREQVEKLETLLEEQRKKIEILEKEKQKFAEDLEKNVGNNHEYELVQNNTIELLSSNVESAQNQCKDLLSVVEMLSKENEHYRCRIQKLEAGEPILLSNSFKRKSLDYDTLLTHNERLKKMLLDKDVEVCTLKTKVKFYGNDIKELLNYRETKYKSLFNKECNQPEHCEKFMLIQNEMKNMRLELHDKDQEISDLTSINKELEHKIENMIIQTRNDLENLSHKYKLPELETMSEELQNSDKIINELRLKLSDSEAEIKELKLKIENSDMDEVQLQLEEGEKKLSQLEAMLRNKQEEMNDNRHIIEENIKLKKEIEDLSGKLQDLKQYRHIKVEFDLLYKEYNQLTEHLKELNENQNAENYTQDFITLRTDIESFWHIYQTNTIEKELVEIKIASWINKINLNCIAMTKFMESEQSSKKKLEEISANFKDSQKEVGRLTAIIEEVSNSRLLLVGEKTGLELEVTKLKEELRTKNDELNNLRNQVETLRNEDKNVTIKTLEDASIHLEEAKIELIKYQEELVEKCDIIKKYEAEIGQLEVEVKSARENLEFSRKEVGKLQKAMSEVSEKGIGRKSVDTADKGSIEDEDFMKMILLKAEVSIREELRIEYERKIGQIEETYRNIFEINQLKLNKYKEQENNYRHQLADLLGKYSQLITPIQKENEELKINLEKFEMHYNELRRYVETSKKEYNLLVEKMQKDTQKAIDAWKMWAKAFVQGCLSIEKLNAQSRNTILNSLKDFDNEVETVDKYFEEKIKQYKKKCSSSKT